MELISIGPFAIVFLAYLYEHGNIVFYCIYETDSIYWIITVMSYLWESIPASLIYS